MTVLLSIFLIALILRIFFAYGTSAGSGFALSGGSDAAYHLRVIEHIVTTGSHIITDPALNYPFGGLNYNPPLFDWAVALAAFPLTLFGFSAADASSIALVYSTAIVGALTCIPVYFLGKEMFGRKAGYIAAAFFAISSIAIVKTVFSNGTESAFFVFFFVLTSLFLLRAIKAYKPTEGNASAVDGLMSPFKKGDVLKNLLLAGVSLLALQLSWIGFLSVITIISVMMVVQAVIDRFRGKSAIAYVSMYASVMLFATLIASLYYLVVMGMTMVVAGPLCVILLATVISFIISAHRVWVITIPVSIIIFAAFMAMAWFFVPSLFSAMTSGATPYAHGVFGSLLASAQGIALSSQAVYAGMVTMWFSVVLVAYMLFRLPKNAGSPKYMFILTWFLALLYASWQNVDLAYLAAPMYAIGTGVVIVWILKRADLKGYAENFKGATITSVWRKILKPVPFLTVIGTVFILLMPNVLYAVDASIPSNQKGDYNSEMSGTLGGMGSGGINYLGATNFYIKDDDWTLSTAWDHFSQKDDPGSLVTWLDYGMEAVAKGGFNVVADSFGNGYSAASNIMLGTPSGSIAAMTVRLIQYNGVMPIDLDVAMELAAPGSAHDLNRIIFNGVYPLGLGVNDPSTIDYVRTNPGIFGATNFNITEENAMYLAAAYFLTSTFTDGTIAEFYDIVCSETGRSIDYIGVTGNMLPIYYGDGNIFSTLAYLNDYRLDRNGSPTNFYTAGVPYFGYYYTYNDTMYETMLWKALIGPSLYDYRLMINNPSLSFPEMISGLMFSDGTIKAYPGYGLGNFYADENEWWVTYTPKDADGNQTGEWELMLAKDALAKQAADRDEDNPDNGGFINYFGGMAFLRYDGSGAVYSGTVWTDDTPTGETGPVTVSGLTVAVFDVDGNLLGKTVTNAAGEYSIMISDSAGVPTEFKLYSGPVYSMEVLVGAIADLDGVTEISLSYVTGILIPDLGEDITVELNGRVSGESYTVETYINAGGEREFAADVVPDVYSVVMTINGVQVYTGTFTLYPGDINVGEIDIKSVDVQITILNKYGMAAAIEDGDVEIVSIDDPTSVIVTEAENNVARAKVAPGVYTVRLAGNEFNGEPYILVPNTSNTLTATNTTSFTATLNSVSRLTVRMVEAAEVEIINVAPGDIITLTNGAYAPRGTYTTTVVADGTTASICVPVGDYGNASTYTATITSVSGGTVTTSYAKVDGTTNTVDAAAAAVGTVEVTINMEYDNEAIGGVVAFIDSDMMILTAAVGDSGESTVMLPVGEYTLYAYARETVARDSKAYFGNVTISGPGPETIDIELKDAVFVSGRVQYTGPSTGTAATSTIGVAFVPVFIKDGDNIIMTSTDALGNYSVVLPKKNYVNNTPASGSTPSVQNAGGAYTETLFGAFMRPLANVSINIAANTSGTATANLTVIPTTPEMDGTITLPDTGTLSPDTVMVDFPGDPGIEVKFEYTATQVRMTVYNYNKNLAYLVLSSNGDLPVLSPTTGRTLLNGGEDGLIITLSAATDTSPVWSRQYTLTYTGTPTLEITAVNLAMSVALLYPPGSDVTVSSSGTDVSPIGYALAATASGPGKIQWSPDGVTYADITGTMTIPAGRTVYLQAVDAGGDSVFYSWTDDLAGNSAVTQIVMDGKKTIGAVFFDDTTPGTTSFTLDAAVTGAGIVQWSADGTTYDDVTATITVPAGETVFLQAVTAGGSTFIEWTGDITDPAEILEIIMDAAVSVTAEFSPAAPFTITSSATGTGTILWSDDGGVTYNALLSPQSVSGEILLMAEPDTGSSFYSWTGDLAGNNPDVTLFVEGDMTIGAIFYVDTDTTFALDAVAAGPGKIQWSADGITYDDVTATITVPEGETAFLQAVAIGGSVFNSWTGDLTGTSEILEITTMDANTAVEAEFVDTLVYRLTARSYDLLIEPSDSTPGTIGDYYSGKMRIFAGQTVFDANPLVVSVIVIAFEVESGDKISFVGGKAFESSSSTDTEKIYYILEEDWSTCVLIIQNDEQIAYINLADAGADLGPVAVSDYMGDKATISGYVGMVANGTMDITMTLGDPVYYTVSIEVPIVNGTYNVALPTDMDGETITYVFTPSIEITSGGIDYIFELSPLIAPQEFTSGDGRIVADDVKEDGENTINMEMVLTEMTPPTDPDVEIDNVVMDYSVAGSAVGSFDVKNNSGATIVLRGGTGWSSIDFGGNKNYILIDPMDPLDPPVNVSFTATYDPNTTGDGNADLSVVAWDVTGAVLLAQPVMTAAPIDYTGSVDWEVGPNRVSRNEYGYGVTLTNDGPERIKVSISINDPTEYSDNNWYASIVDAGNLVIDPSLEFLVDPSVVPYVTEFVINGNSSATFYLRLIWTGEGEPSLDGLPLTLTVNGELVELDDIPTNINTPKLSATGEGIFDSMNGIPNIVWVLLALSILTALLIVWLGIRRGVFTRRR